MSAAFELVCLASVRGSVVTMTTGDDSGGEGDGGASEGEGSL